MAGMGTRALKGNGGKNGGGKDCCGEQTRGEAGVDTQGGDNIVSYVGVEQGFQIVRRGKLLVVLGT